MDFLKTFINVHQKQSRMEKRMKIYLAMTTTILAATESTVEETWTNNDQIRKGMIGCVEMCMEIQKKVNRPSEILKRHLTLQLRIKIKICGEIK